MSFSTISSARALSLGVVIGNSLGNDVGVISSSLSYYSMNVGVYANIAVVLLMLGDGILAYLSPLFMALI